MKKTIRRSDLILIGSLLLVGLVLCAVLLLTRTAGTQVQVRVNGSVIKTFPMDTDRTYTVHGTDGGTNELVISGGSAYVSEASCPDGLCMGMGKISHSGQSVICLPNKVVIEVVGGEPSEEGTRDDDAVDIIAGGKQG